MRNRLFWTTSENIMLWFDLTLMNNCYLNNGKEKLCIKVDLRKAFDSQHWDGIRKSLEGMNFPPTFFRWIYAYISTPRFSILINGSPKGYFNSSCGISWSEASLFFLTMETISLILDHALHLGLIKTRLPSRKALQPYPMLFSRITWCFFLLPRLAFQLADLNNTFSIFL